MVYAQAYMLDHKRSIVALGQTQRQRRDISECYENRCNGGYRSLVNLWIGLGTLECHREDEVSGCLLVSPDTAQQLSGLDVPDEEEIRRQSCEELPYRSQSCFLLNNSRGARGWEWWLMLLWCRRDLLILRRIHHGSHQRMCPPNEYPLINRLI